MEEKARPSAASTKRTPSLPANYVSLRQLEEKHQQQTKEEEANPMEPKEEDRTTKRAPLLPPNYVSLRQLQEQQQRRREEEEARKAKEEEERRRLEMMMRKAEEAEAERGKRQAEGAGSQDRQHQQQQQGEIGTRYANQRRWDNKRKGKSARPTCIAQPAESGRRRPEEPANARPDPAPAAAQEEKECEGNEKTDAAENSQVGVKQGPRKEGRGQSHRRNSGKRNAGVEPGEPSAESAAKEEAAASAGPSADAAAEIATRLEGALNLAPVMAMKEEAPPAPSKSNPPPARKRASRGGRRDGSMNLPAVTRQDGPLALAPEMGMRPEAGSGTPSEINGATRGGRRHGFKNVPVPVNASIVADEREGDSGTSLANPSIVAKKEAIGAAPQEGGFGLRGGGRGRLGDRYRERGRSREDGGVLWIRRSPRA